ncbi:MAG: hypothetical protein V3S16_14155 [Candidatus Desulfatibia sp.]|uniref:hypothetical protein n=1 Tax=Candidatus Desulfatibia sp. TaxID=3101189 RepID=UPI002F307920
MTRIISRSELGRWAGVNKSTSARACKKHLSDAVVADGVDVEHPLVRQWLSEHGVDELPPKQDASKPKGKKRVRKKAAAKTQPRPPPPLETQQPQAHDLDHLEDLTVREVVMRYGSVDGFKRFVDSLKSISEFKYKELRAKQQRGDLVDRQKVAGLVFPMIDVAFSRLVTDVPVAVSKSVVARVQSGGPETYIDVQKIIRDANSRVLKSVKQSAMNLEILNDAN